MLNVIEQKNVRITAKTILALILVGLAIFLPQIVHLTVGSRGGMIFLPMYLPVILSGFLLGSYWGLGIGVMSPVLSYLLTNNMGFAMPSLERLPFMILELSILAFVTGLYTNRINTKNVFKALIFAQIIGRITFFTTIFLVQKCFSFEQMRLGLIGMGLQIILVPVIILLVNRWIGKKE